MVHVGVVWKVVLLGFGVFVVGLVTLSRGARSADAALDCEEEEERQALGALGRRRRILGLALMALGVGVSLFPFVFLR